MYIEPIEDVNLNTKSCIPILPNASQAFCTDFSIANPPLHTSSSTATALIVFGSAADWLISSHKDLRRWMRRAAATARQPALANSRQNSLPKPEDAPVTRTIFPFRSCHGSIWLETALAISRGKWYYQWRKGEAWYLKSCLLWWYMLGKGDCNSNQLWNLMRYI